MDIARTLLALQSVPRARIARRAANAAIAAVVLLALAGCEVEEGLAPRAPSHEEPALPPLPVQQVRAYPETATGRFVSLADFEEARLSGRPGRAQVGHFIIRPAGKGAGLKYVVNITRTGVGALEASLPVGSSLVYRLPEIHNFSEYSLLSVAVYCRSVRDDLKLLLVTDQAGWESYPVLLRKGWNNVLMDIRRAKAPKGFDVGRVREIRLRLNAPPGQVVADEPVVINVDDIMLIDNRREIHPVPEGMRLVKSGLDFDLHLGGDGKAIEFRRAIDGLWQTSERQAVVVVTPAAAGALRPALDKENLSAMGWQRMGEVRIVEHNSVRVQMSNMWYFPRAGGEWKSLDVRRIHWHYTFYPDGRSITAVTLHRTGKEGISITPPAGAVWSDGSSATRTLSRSADGGGHRWCFQFSPAGPQRQAHQSNYAQPARLEMSMGKKDIVFGDANRDGFDETEGCYRLRAQKGHCRFFLQPSAAGLADPVFRVRGGWISAVTANSAGQALRQLIRLDDGSVLFRLPGMIKGRRWVEVTGKVPLLSEE